MCGLCNDSPTTHHELSSTAVGNGELTVIDTLGAFNEYVNQFYIDDKSHLFVLSSGVRVPKAVMKDVLRVEEVGKIEKEKFNQEWLTKDGDDIKDFLWLAPQGKALIHGLQGIKRCGIQASLACWCPRYLGGHSFQTSWTTTSQCWWGFFSTDTYFEHSLRSPER